MERIVWIILELQIWRITKRRRNNHKLWWTPQVRGYPLGCLWRRNLEELNHQYNWYVWLSWCFFYCATIMNVEGILVDVVAMHRLQENKKGTTLIVISQILGLTLISMCLLITMIILMFYLYIGSKTPLHNNIMIFFIYWV